MEQCSTQHRGHREPREPQRPDVPAEQRVERMQHVTGEEDGRGVLARMRHEQQIGTLVGPVEPVARPPHLPPRCRDSEQGRDGQAARADGRPRRTSPHLSRSISKADLVPKDTNLLEEYASFAELEAACEAFCQKVNTRPHRLTKRAPVEMLAEERTRLHPVPAVAHTVAFGTTRVVPANTPMVTFESGQYSVPHALLGATVWVRTQGVGTDEHVVIVHVSDDGPVEVARHARATPGTPKIDLRQP